MRILFIGPTGTNMQDGIRKLADYCRIKEGGLTTEQLAEYGKKFISTFFVESKFEVALRAYLDLDNLSKQQEIWEKAFTNTLDEISSTDSKHYFLCMHLPHYRNDKFFPVPNIELINRFKPDQIITLIDDVHTCFQRIKLRNPSRSIFTMRDILLWRSVSMYLGDVIARAVSANQGKSITNKIVAVKHPVTMFQKLIFHPETLISYCSFTISKIRDKPPKVEAVNNFRKKMHEKFCIFDPLAMDDRLVQNKYEEWVRNGKKGDKLVLEQKDRWDIGNDFSLVSDTLTQWGKESIYPIEIKITEVQDIVEKKKSESGEDRSVIDNHIRERDFRLIDQSDTMVAFRPKISGEISDGVASEANYISQVNPKDWFYVWNDQEDGSTDSGPFKSFLGAGTKFVDDESLIEHLVKQTPKLKKY